MNSKEYWNNKIIEWEDSMHGASHLSFIERLASYFRKPVLFRNKTVLETILPLVDGKVVLELGCGSGYFAFDLCKNSKVKKIIGLDISEQAINRAKKLSQEMGLAYQCEFYRIDAISAQLPAADITVGMGFLDYLTAEEIVSLGKNIKSRYIVFSLTERKFSILRYIHILYLLSQRCPKHFYYTKKEWLGFLAGKFGEINFIEDKRLSFACVTHNLPTNPKV